MKVLKNILKWIICVCLSFSVIYTITNSVDYLEGIIVLKGEENYYSELFTEENVKSFEEQMNIFFTEGVEEKSKELYNKYPAGTVRLMSIFSDSIKSAETAFISLILGLIMGTATFLLINSKEKNEIKIAIVFYLMSVVILGFLESYTNMYISGNKFWMFPNEYIIPVTIAFGLVILIRVIRQKDLANKLNKKLKERHTEKK